MLAMTGILDFLIFWTCVMCLNDIACLFALRWYEMKIQPSSMAKYTNENKSNAVSNSASHTRKSSSMESVAQCSGLFITAPVGGLPCQLQAGRPPTRNAISDSGASCQCLAGKPGKRDVPHLAPCLTREIASTTIIARRSIIFNQSMFVVHLFSR